MKMVGLVKDMAKKGRKMEILVWGQANKIRKKAQMAWQNVMVFMGISGIFGN